jgi:hypothetical protein
LAESKPKTATVNARMLQGTLALRRKDFGTAQETYHRGADELLLEGPLHEQFI